MADRVEETVSCAGVPAERAEPSAAEGRPFGRPGRPFDRGSPFFIGMAGAAGVAVTYGLIQLVLAARSVLVLTGLALFIAIGLDPAVRWLARRRLPLWVAVTLIAMVVLGLVVGFLDHSVAPGGLQRARIWSSVWRYCRSPIRNGGHVPSTVISRTAATRSRHPKAVDRIPAPLHSERPDAGTCSDTTPFIAMPGTAAIENNQRIGPAPRSSMSPCPPP
jgi:hypothetical protein